MGRRLRHSHRHDQTALNRSAEWNRQDPDADEVKQRMDAFLASFTPAESMAISLGV
jgi:hypothetical protein